MYEDEPLFTKTQMLGYALIFSAILTLMCLCCYKIGYNHGIDWCNENVITPNSMIHEHYDNYEHDYNETDDNADLNNFIK